MPGCCPAARVRRAAAAFFLVIITTACALPVNTTTRSRVVSTRAPSRTRYSVHVSTMDAALGIAPRNGSKRVRGGLLVQGNMDVLSRSTDGFFTALRMLRAEVDIDVVEIKTMATLRRDVASHPRAWADQLDFVLVKSAFHWGPEVWARRNLRGIAAALILLISGTRAPTNTELRTYDCIFYETETFLERSRVGARHTCTVHAFGVNTRLLVRPDPPPEVIYDYVYLGRFMEWKRPLLLLKKGGKRLAIGEPTTGSIAEKLRRGGVTVMGNLGSNTALAPVLATARAMYAPQTYDGGGERAVLEARVIGLAVEVASDNPKLLELVTSPIWSAEYYAARLAVGICHTIIHGRGVSRPPLRLPASTGRDGETTDDQALIALRALGDASLACFPNTAAGGVAAPAADSVELGRMRER